MPAGGAVARAAFAEVAGATANGTAASFGGAGAEDVLVPRRPRVWWARWQPSSFAEADEECSVGDALEVAEAEADVAEVSSELAAYSAREHGIHQAWLHAHKANDLAKNAAEAALEAANEAREAQHLLDMHDVIAMDSESQSDVAKAGSMVESSALPYCLVALAPTSLPRAPAFPRSRAPRRRWPVAELQPFL
mmetsp:Transcript_120814/g.341624  ORF Transcript_120814/g.341624 Transcript_120814/m.341624 type:complete len:193 (-) Transcript_120814:125-703(-)|eukprot:CAMPEP_0117536038 /NCGR_PEP_ID=MMETSP0784-20121206/41243_1 /TAXON_ID=39447 /ORGANISM="" /LENGTH=192 /DNA_ID=CAMNT_0005332581 /DNA_START=12 /DNA_END=590 /DNA_ORIENTATION=+